MAAMVDLWDHSDEVICTHPGMPTVRGWDEVRLSWEQILRHGGEMQFIVTDERVVVYGDVGWVTCTENIIGSDGPRGTVCALNLFARSRDGRLADGRPPWRWRRVAPMNSCLSQRSADPFPAAPPAPPRR